MVDLLIICQGTASSSQYGVEYGAAYGEHILLTLDNNKLGYVRRPRPIV